MDASTEALLAKAALDELTLEETARLEALAVTDPEVAAEWKEAREIGAALAALADAARMKTDPMQPPAAVLKELDDARRNAFREARATTPADAAELRTRKSIRQSGWWERAKAWLEDLGLPAERILISASAVATVVIILVAIWWPNHSGSSQPGTYEIRSSNPMDLPPMLLAPRRDTAFVEPLFVWSSNLPDPFHINIYRGGSDTPVYTAQNMRSPVRFSAFQATKEAGNGGLQPGETIRIELVPVKRGESASWWVRIAADASGTPGYFESPAAAVAGLRELLDAGRPGDAIMYLSRIPEEWFDEKPSLRDLRGEVVRAVYQMPAQEEPPAKPEPPQQPEPSPPVQ